MAPIPPVPGVRTVQLVLRPQGPVQPVPGPGQHQRPPHARSISISRWKPPASAAKATASWVVEGRAEPLHSMSVDIQAVQSKMVLFIKIGSSFFLSRIKNGIFAADVIDVICGSGNRIWAPQSAQMRSTGLPIDTKGQFFTAAGWEYPANRDRISDSTSSMTISSGTHPGSRPRPACPPPVPEAGGGPRPSPHMAAIPGRGSTGEARAFSRRKAWEEQRHSVLSTTQNRQGTVEFGPGWAETPPNHLRLAAGALDVGLGGSQRTGPSHDDRLAAAGTNIN